MLEIVKIVARTIGVSVLFEILILIVFNKDPDVGLLDIRIILFLMFEGTLLLFPTVAVPHCIPINSIRVPISLHPHQHLLPLIF